MRLKNVVVVLVVITILTFIVIMFKWNYSKRIEIERPKIEMSPSKLGPHLPKLQGLFPLQGEKVRGDTANESSQINFERSRSSKMSLPSDSRNSLPQVTHFPSPKFEIGENFTLPMPHVTLPVHELIQQRWVKDLQNYLNKIPPYSSNKSLITIVSCDLKFKGLLLNWLTSALLSVQPPLTSQILLLTLDQPLHKLMTEHGFDSLYAQGNQLIQSSRIKYALGHSRTPELSLVMVWRLTMMRLLNHWGYDVANYDTDAIILKNTEQLFYQEFSSSHFVGSRANFPATTSKMYGLTMCGGLFMVKSSPATEKYWEKVSEVTNDARSAFDDQIRANVGLNKMNMKFNHTGLYESKNWMGRSSNGFTVTILHFNIVCRWTCKEEEKEFYYVWHCRHPHGSTDMVLHEIRTLNLKSDGVWFLRDNWSEVVENSTAVGLDWLREMKN